MNEDIFHLGVKALIRNDDGRILLLKANPKQVKSDYKVAYWDLPGGRIKKGGTIEKTLMREIEEETGITAITSFQSFAMFTMPVRIVTGDIDVGLILSVYLIQAGSTASIRLSSEHTEYAWFTSLEAACLLTRYPKEFAEKLTTV